MGESDGSRSDEGGQYAGKTREELDAVAQASGLDPSDFATKQDVIDALEAGHADPVDAEVAADRAALTDNLSGRPPLTDVAVARAAGRKE